jgi:formate dehydrogenase subunit gamma
MRRPVLRHPLVALGLAAALCASIGAGIVLTFSPVDAAPAQAPDQAQTQALASSGVPGNVLGSVSDAEVWRTVRQGVAGTVSIPDKKAAVLIQSEGDNWRSWRNGPIAIVGAVAFWVMFLVVVSFHGYRGGIRMSHRPTGRDVLRFTPIERFAHWLTAGSFLLLAVTGVNMIYGRHVVLPLIGPQAFSWLSWIAKHVHNYVGFAFIAGLVLIFGLWVRNNLWDRWDWNWIRKGGGLLVPSEHPPAGKFNFGQKTVFWMVMGGGGILAATGLNLLFPFFLLDLHQMQWIQAIHGTLSQVLCMLMVAHIYIGTVGMEGAYRAMSTGWVDESWAREHHAAWLDEVRQSDAGQSRDLPGHAPAAPAE